MKYLLILSLMISGCSDQNPSSNQVNECNRLASKVGFNSHVTSGGLCVFTRTIDDENLTFIFPIEELDGAGRMLDLTQYMAIRPLLVSCIKKCLLSSPKDGWAGDRGTLKFNCSMSCRETLK
jgi:hypothetical protein